MTLGTVTLGTGVLGASTVDKVVEAIEISSDIPTDAKMAIRDFIKESFQNLWESLEDLIEIQPPTELLEYWNLVIELVQKLIGA